MDGRLGARLEFGRDAIPQASESALKPFPGIPQLSAVHGLQPMDGRLGARLEFGRDAIPQASEKFLDALPHP